MALLDSIGDYLTTQGLVGGATGWTLAKDWEPPSPDQVVTLFSAGGRPPESAVRYPRFQVRVRGGSHGGSAAKAKIQAIFASLHESAPGYLDSPTSNAVDILAIDEPILIDTDEKYRPAYVQRYEVLYTR